LPRQSRVRCSSAPRAVRQGARGSLRRGRWRPPCVACSSGTAAIHVAVAAIDPEPGDEIITTPITDMGALTPILYQGAIPVFADVDRSLQRDGGDDRGAPQPEDESDRRHAPLREPVQYDRDHEARRGEVHTGHRGRRSGLRCAARGRKVGTIGAIGCFSLQQGSTSRPGKGAGRRRRPRSGPAGIPIHQQSLGYGDKNPDHYFLALNYRMSELQGAVAAAQLPKLPRSCGAGCAPPAN